MQPIALRLNPGQDLKVELDRFVQQQAIDAACILTCVGSLTQAVLRFAGQSEGTFLLGKFEIVSLVGVLSRSGSHSHIAIADGTGQTMGGHLLKGCLIYTTGEIIIGVLPHLRFRRDYDPLTGYKELCIEQDELNENE